MKKSVILVLMSLEFGALCGICAAQLEFPELFSAAVAAPFEQIGFFLRKLSLSGTAGNLAAVMLWTLVSLAPALYALSRICDRARRWENICLFVTSAALFPILYNMANPDSLAGIIGISDEGVQRIYRAVLGGALWSALVCYVILRLVRVFASSDTGRLYVCFRAVLYALCFVFIAAIAFDAWLPALTALRGAESALDGVFAILRFFVAALPYTLDIRIIFASIDLLDALTEPKTGGEVSSAAGKLTKKCALSLALTAASTMLFNLASVLLAGELTDISVNVSIPVVSLAFILLVLLFARLAAENRELSDDNELFI